jgi:hypothetical protein
VSPGSHLPGTPPKDNVIVQCTATDSSHRSAYSVVVGWAFIVTIDTGWSVPIAQPVEGSKQPPPTGSNT